MASGALGQGVFIFIVIFIMINHMNTDALALCLVLQNVLLYLDDDMDEEMNIFQIAKVQPQDVA